MKKGESEVRNLFLRVIMWLIVISLALVVIHNMVGKGQGIALGAIGAIQ